MRRGNYRCLQMINPAQYNTLFFDRFTENGAYLVDAERENEVLLPNRYVPDDPQEGDSIEVFIYFDSEDRAVATTTEPLIMLGQVRPLKVVDVTRIGAFLDWGLPKDLLVPFKNQLNPMEVGEFYPVSIYIDNTTGRIVGSTKIGYIVQNKEEITLEPREEVQIIVASRRERGYRVIINQKHWGMIYDNQIFSDIQIGDALTAYVLKITEDFRIDVSLQKPGLDGVQVAAEAIMNSLKENGGSIPIGDKTDPALVQLQLGISKKVFKKAGGYLMRQRKLVVEDNKTTMVEFLDK